jgi:D-amino-acid dehydrogenase
MKILVMGAGVIGVTAAYYLAREGHEVTVVDRQAGAAEETSFANAGLVAPGHAYAWASPKALKILLKSLFSYDQALRVKLSADPRLWSYFLKFLGQCTATRARINTERKLRLCRFSLEELKAVVAETGVAYDGRDGGLLYFYRSQESFERGAANCRILIDNGQPLEIVDRARAVEIDPALAPANGSPARSTRPRTKAAMPTYSPAHSPRSRPSATASPSPIPTASRGSTPRGTGSKRW